jgi:hypothetical protein
VLVLVLVLVLLLVLRSFEGTPTGMANTNGYGVAEGFMGHSLEPH